MVRRALSAVALLVLAGCASIEPGMTREQVLSAWGQPTRSMALAGGAERWQYGRQPASQQTVMVDLDAQGQVRSVRQVLTRQDFSRIATDVEREFGLAPDQERVHSWNGPILTYRFYEGGVDLYYWVYLDPTGVVRRAHEGMDFRTRRQAFP
jgi:hypothetical protein